MDAPPHSADSLLTVDDIARILKLNPQTVRNWIDQGYLGAIQIGRNVRVTRAEFDRLIEESSTEPKRPHGRTPPRRSGTASCSRTLSSRDDGSTSTLPPLRRR